MLCFIWKISFKLVKNLQNADINGRLISPTAERLSYMDFTVAVSVLQFALIQPTPKIHNRYLATVQPFQPVVYVTSNSILK